MSDIYNTLADLPSFFDQSKKTPGSLSYEELQMRRKLAAAMASRNRPYPKTVGEGLSALGEGLADRWANADYAKAEAAQRARSAETQKTLAGDVSYPTLDTGETAAPPVTQLPVVPPEAPPGAPVVAPQAPPVAPPPGAAPGGAPAPLIRPVPPAAPQRTPAPGMRAGMAQAMAMRAQPEGPVGAPQPPIVPGSVSLGGVQQAALQPSNEPSPRSPISTATVPQMLPSTVPTGAPPPPPPEPQPPAPPAIGALSSLANGPSSDLASEEDARLADVTGQAAVAPPRVQFASRDQPVTDAGTATPTMGGVVDAGVADAATARREQIAESIAKQRVAQAGGGATAPAPPPVQPSPTQQPIPKAPPGFEEAPRDPGPQPTLQGILNSNPAYLARMKQMRGIMADPGQTDADRAMAGKIYTDMETRANDVYKNQFTVWHEGFQKKEAHRLATEERQRARAAEARAAAGEGRTIETHSWAQQKAPGEIAKIYQDLRQSGETHEVAMRKAPIEYQKLVDEAQRARETHAQAMAKGAQDIITPAAQPPAPGAPPDPRLGTVHSPQRTGVPNTPPVPPGQSPKEWSEKQTPELVKAISAYEKAAPSFNDVIKTLKLAREHPGNKWGTGVTAEIAGKIPATDAYGFAKIMEQIGGKNFLNAYQQLKGGGAITEIEGTKAEAAQARLARPQSKEDFKKSMDAFEEAVREDFEAVQRKVNKPVTAWRAHGDNSSYAPDIGERRGDKEYIGGKPSDPMSWRRVQ